MSGAFTENRGKVNGQPQDHHDPWRPIARPADFETASRQLLAG